MGESVARETGWSQDDQRTHEDSLSLLSFFHILSGAHPKIEMGPTIKELGKSKSF